MNSDTKQIIFTTGGHPDENQILLALERELSLDEMLEVEEHLGVCWSCRARSEEMQRGILAFTEYRENRYLPSLEAAPNGFRNFPWQLRIAIAECQPPSFGTRFRQAFSKLFVLTPVRWAGAVATITAAALFWTQVLFDPATVSAQELLTRATAAQNSVAVSGSGQKPRVIRQKLQIRSGSETFVRDFEWTAGKSAVKVPWSSQSDVRQWNSPLTAEGFAAWRASLATKKDKVKRSGDKLTLDTTAETGSIRSASIVVRAKDFHPVEQHIHFADDRRLDFLELAFDVSDEQPAAERTVPAQEAAHNRPPTLNETAPATPVDLDETELAVRYAMFIKKLDLGEDLVILSTTDKVTVTGTASSTEQADAIRASLGNMQNVQVLVTAPGAASTSESTPRHSASVKGQASSVPSLLRDVLENSFGSREERLDFVDQCLTASDTALSQAWALKRLADRYDEATERRLNPESIRKVREMLRVHLDQLRRANTALDPLLRFLPDSRSQSPSAPTNFRDGVSSLFREVQRQDSVVARLIVGTQANGQDLSAAAETFRSTHQTVGALAIRLQDILDAR